MYSTTYDGLSAKRQQERQPSLELHSNRNRSQHVVYPCPCPLEVLRCHQWVVSDAVIGGVYFMNYSTCHSLDTQRHAIGPVLQASPELHPKHAQWLHPRSRSVPRVSLDARWHRQIADQSGDLERFKWDPLCLFLVYLESRWSVWRSYLRYMNGKVPFERIPV